MYDPDWVEVSRLALVDVEDLLGVPDHPLEVARKDEFGVSGGKDLPEGLPVLAQLLPLLVDLGHQLGAADHVAQDVVVEQLPHVPVEWTSSITPIPVVNLLKETHRSFVGSNLYFFSKAGLLSLIVFKL